MSAPVDEVSDHPVAVLGRAARTLLPPGPWAYLMGAAGDGGAAVRNETALAGLLLSPHVGRDVGVVDTGVELFGRRLAHPLVIAPSALHTLFHPEGELATAAGARAAAATFTISMEAGTRWEAVTGTDLWCQVSPQRDPALTRSLVARAEAVGATAVVLTLDTPVSGARHTQLRAMPEIPGRISRPNLPAGDRDNIASTYVFPGSTWDDVERIVAATTLPVIGKGILRADDAVRAVTAGLAAVVVSNHGGRNLDAAPPTIRCLPRIVDALQGAVPVLVDGGFRRGTDVLKALALGASAVMLGRPVLWGLAARGADGVREVIDTVRTELRDAMALCGVTTVAGCTPDLLDAIA